MVEVVLSSVQILEIPLLYPVDDVAHSFFLLENEQEYE